MRWLELGNLPKIVYKKMKSEVRDEKSEDDKSLVSLDAF
jgi:hypothetical protein